MTANKKQIPTDWFLKNPHIYCNMPLTLCSGIRGDRKPLKRQSGRINPFFYLLGIVRFCC